MRIATVFVAGLMVLSAAFSPALAADEAPKGWGLAGSAPQDFTVQKDTTVFHGGKASVLLKSRSAQPTGFGTLMQTISATDYLGKRVRLSVFIKADQVGGWAGVWMRVDPKTGGNPLAFDNMLDRPIKATSDWTRYEVVLDVPKESGAIALGVLLNGIGSVWMDDFQLEVVSKKIPVTDQVAKGPKKPVNIGFEE